MGRARGLVELEAFKNGESLTRSEAMLAFCADCMNLYQDEIRNCKNTNCPMYAYMPYRTSDH